MPTFRSAANKVPRAVSKNSTLMRTSLGARISALFLAAAPPAQSRHPDLSGRWQLVERTAAERALETLDITSPDRILITQTPLAIVIEHPSRTGTHPEAGTFEYGAGGRIGGLPGRGNSIEERWGVTHIGTQLMISRSMTRPGDQGGPITLARGSMWRLEDPNRLVIEFGEERTGERPRIATRTYAPHVHLLHLLHLWHRCTYCTQYCAARSRSLIGGCV